MKSNQTSDLFNVHHCLSSSACSCLILDDRQLHTGIYKLVNEPKSVRKQELSTTATSLRLCIFLYRNSSVGITIYFYFCFVRVSSTIASQAAKVEHDHNSNISNTQGTEPPSGLTSTGNFSVSTLFNNHYAVRPPFMGSSWNIFGVPTNLNKDPSSTNYLHTRRTQK